jgi:O-antigen/teichoic acid export membrane protein
MNLSETFVIVTLIGGITSLIAIAAGFLIMQLPFSFLNNASVNDFYLALILIPITVFSNVYTRLFTALKAFELFAYLSVSTALINLLSTFIFLYGYSLSVEGALYANIVAGGISIVVAIFLMKLKFNLAFVKTTLSQFIDILSYEIRHYVGKISNEVNFRIGEVLLALFATKEQIGFFTIAVSITSRVNIVPDALNPVLMPKIADNHATGGPLVSQSARITAMICGSLLLALAVFAEEIVSILFSPAFLPSVLLIRILAVGMLVRATGKVFIPYLLGTNHPGVVSLAIIAGIPVNLGLLLVLLPEIGLPGAALAMIAGFIVSSLILMKYFIKISGESFRKIWRFQRSDFTLLTDTLKKIYNR